MHTVSSSHGLSMFFIFFGARLAGAGSSAAALAAAAFSAAARSAPVDMIEKQSTPCSWRECAHVAADETAVTRAVESYFVRIEHSFERSSA